MDRRSGKKSGAGKKVSRKKAASVKRTRNSTKGRPFARLVRRYVWRGDAGAKITAVTQIVVASLAVIAASLGVVGVDFVSAAIFRAVALMVGATILITQIVTSEQWQKQAAVLSELRSGLRREFPDRIESIVTSKLAAASHASVREIPPSRVEAELREILNTSSNWTFQGGSGRWLRSATLPHLAHAKHAAVNVTALLLDPRDEDLCLQWVKSEFSRRYSERTLTPVDPRMIQANVLATIYSLGWYAACSLIRPRIVLLDSFSPQRFDVGSTALMITVATRNEPAIYARKGSWFYETVRSDLAKACERNPRVVLPQEGSRRPLLYPALDEVDGPDVSAALALTTIIDGSGAEVALLDRYADPGPLDFASIAREVRQPRLV